MFVGKYYFLKTFHTENAFGIFANGDSLFPSRGNDDTSCDDILF